MLSEVPVTRTGPVISPLRCNGYARDNIVNDTGCAFTSMSYVMNFSPHVTRPLPVRYEGSPGPLRCVIFAFEKRTSSQEESNVAVPATVPPRRRNSGNRY